MAPAGQPPPGSSSAAPAAQRQGGYTPSAEERSALPDEPQRFGRIVVSDDEVVGLRQVIGESGSTGFSIGPHLHFEVRHGEDYLDPCWYLGC